MNKEFVPYEQALALKELGFDRGPECLAYYNTNPRSKTPAFDILKPFDHEYCLPAPLYQQAFKFFRDKYGYTYSIGRTNICVYHLMVQGTLLTNMIQGCKSYEEAELKCIQEFIDAAKQNL